MATSGARRSFLGLLFLSCSVTACGAAGARAATDVPPPPSSETPTVGVPVTDAMPTRGPDDAAVTIVVFGDFETPALAEAWPTLGRIFERYPGDVRLVFRHYLLPSHEHAARAAEVSNEAQAQLGDRGFFEMAELLLREHEHLEPDDLEGYAAIVGLDVDRLRAALASHVHRPAIEADGAAAEAIGVVETPTFFVNGRLLVGAPSFDELDAAVAVALHSAHLRIRAGLAPGDIYEDVVRYATATRIEVRPRDRRRARDEEEDPDRVYGVPIPPTAPARGPVAAPVVVQICSDFQCPYCARVVGTLEELERRYAGRIRFVWRDFPLPFHAHAMIAHEAAREAYAQRGDAGFWAMHDLLYENQADLGDEEVLLERLAGTIGLDVGRFRAALASHVHREAIEDEVDELRARTGMGGTPTFLINGRMLVGAQPIEAFVEAVERALAGS